MKQGCNSTYRLRYWNPLNVPIILLQRQSSCNSTYRLRYWNLKSMSSTVISVKLQQYLPFTVLKPSSSSSFLSSPSGCNSTYRLRYWNETVKSVAANLAGSCNSTYRLRYWNWIVFGHGLILFLMSCNSTYRLRYWNLSSSKLYMFSCNVATVPTVYGIETNYVLNVLVIYSCNSYGIETN